jgi:hypothetical protein
LRYELHAVAETSLRWVKYLEDACDDDVVKINATATAVAGMTIPIDIRIRR